MAMTSAANSVDKWAPLRAATDAFFLAPEILVQVGDASGTIFVHRKGNITEDTQKATASTAKWISAVVVMNALQSSGGRYNLDSRLSSIFPYWTQDPSDPRSRITFRHCLSYTAALAGGHCIGASTLQDCARAYYASARSVGEPGSSFDYMVGAPVGLTFAGAAAEVMSGMRFTQLAQTHVYARAGMTATRFNNDANPGLAGGAVSTGRDYMAFLRAYTGGVIVSPTVREEMQRNQFPNATRELIGLLVGHYGLGNWYECLLQGIFSNGMTPACEAKDEHGSLGIRGWWPGHDNRLKYYYSFLIDRDEVISGVLFRLFAKPIVDSIVGGTALPSSPLEITLHTLTAASKLLAHLRAADSAQ